MHQDDLCTSHPDESSGVGICLDRSGVATGRRRGQWRGGGRGGSGGVGWVGFEQ